MILRNETYIGIFIKRDVRSPKIDDLAIIDEEIFNRVQVILEQRNKKAQKNGILPCQTKVKRCYQETSIADFAVDV